jgi:putative membrane protein
MRHEAQTSDYELDVARLGLARSHRPEIHAYAETLINDHARYNEALRDLARSKDVPLPPGMTRRERQRLDRLASTPGRRFDAAFLREARRINGEGIRNFRTEASRTVDPDIREFVVRFLTVEKQHDSLAQALMDTVIASGPAGLRLPRTGDPIVIAPPPDRTPMPIIRSPTDGPHGMPGRD